MLTSPVGAASGCVCVPSETAFESQSDVAPSGAQKIVVQSANPMAGAMGYTTAPASRANTLSETVLILAPLRQALPLRDPVSRFPPPLQSPRHFPILVFGGFR